MAVENGPSKILIWVWEGGRGSGLGISEKEPAFGHAVLATPPPPLP